MKKIFLFLTAATILSLSSCGERDEIIFDGSQALIGFEKDAALFGVVEPTDEFIVTVNVTNAVDHDRPFTVTLNSEETTAPAGGYTILNSENLVIAANSYKTSFTVKGDPSVLTTSRTNLVFDLTLPTGASEDVALSSSRSKFTLTMFKTCPVEATDYVGDYAVQQIVTNPDTGEATFTQSVVTIGPASLGSVDRRFSATFLQAGGEGGVVFSITCDKTTVLSGIDTSLSCGGGDPITLAPGINQGTANPNNDSVFTLTFTEFKEGAADCGLTPQQVTVRFTKI